MLSKRWIVNALLVVLIVGLSLVGIFFEPSATVEKKPAISQLTADEVDTIDIETGDLQLRLQRVNDGWNIESPINWPAQENNVRRLLSILKIEADPLSDTADVDLAALGLQQPKASMHFNGVPLLFGATNNIGERRYAMLDEKIYLLPNVHLVFVNQGLAGLVDRRLLPRHPGIVSLRLPYLELRLDENSLWRSNQAIEFSQASLLRLVDNWRDLQATRISNFDLKQPPRQLIEIELANGEVIEFLLMSEDPEIIIAHPNLGLQYHFRRDYHDQLITLSVDASDS